MNGIRCFHGKQELGEEKTKVSELDVILKQKDASIKEKDERIDILADDLRNIAVMQETDIMESVMAAEKNMRSMVSGQIALQKTLTMQANGLNALLDARGIDKEPIRSRQGEVQEEEKEGTYRETVIDLKTTSNALAPPPTLSKQQTAGWQQ